MENKLPKVIIADDEEFVRCFLRSLLESINYEIMEEIETGDKLVEIMLQKQPDILLLDINMPNLTGLEFLKNYSSLFPKTCIILLTSKTLSSLINEPSLASARCFLNKTTPIEQMSESIQKAWECFKQEKGL